MDDADPQNHTLQLLAHRLFHLAEFRAERFLVPYDHCRLCTRRITQEPAAGDSVTMFARGYVTLRRIDVPGEPEHLQWEWVCEECFEQFRDVAHWKAAEGPVDSAVIDRFRKHVGEVRRRREAEDVCPTERFELEVTWTPEEIVWIASAMGQEYSVADASRILWRNRRLISGRMDSTGYDVILEILRRTGDGQGS